MSFRCLRVLGAARMGRLALNAPVMRPSSLSRGFATSDRDDWTPQQWAEWDELDEVEKLRREPNMYSSPLATDIEATSDRLLDDAWVIMPPRHKGTVIWLHGIGEGMSEAKKIFEIMTPKHFRIVVPKAPLIPITALEEDEERTWYDLEKCVLSDEHDEDYRGIGESARKVVELLDEEIQLLGSEKIVLAGFAQGGALALHAGLQYHLPLAGILSFAGYLPLPDEYPELIAPANKSTKILGIHGKSDEVIPISFARERYEVLKEAGLDFELREDHYLEHCTNETNLFQMQTWFEQRVGMR